MIVVGVARPRDDDILLMPERGAIHLAEPIGVRVAELDDLRRIAVRQDGGAELRGVQHRRQPRDGRGRDAAGVLHFRPAAPCFRRDDHHAVGRVGAVNRGGRRVLQHGDALDVVGIQEVQGIAAGRNAAAGAGAHRHTVDYVERVARGIDRCVAADPDGEAAARLIVVDDLDARHLALDQILRRDDAAGIELRRADRGHGPGRVPGALFAVADHHELRQADGLAVHGEVDGHRVARRDRDGLYGRGVPDHAGPDRVRSRGSRGDDVATVELGKRAAVPVGDRDTRQRLLVLVVRDAAANGSAGRLGAQRCDPDDGQERTDHIPYSFHTCPSDVESWRRASRG